MKAVIAGRAGEVDVLERLRAAVVEIEMPHLELTGVASLTATGACRTRPGFALISACRGIERDRTRRSLMLRMRMLSVMSRAPDQAAAASSIGLKQTGRSPPAGCHWSCEIAAPEWLLSAVTAAARSHR